MDYHKYLCSSHWKEFRQQALQHYGNKCSDCGITGVRFDVHHLTYERLWHEEMTDVVVLCHDCHGIRHNKGYYINYCQHDTIIPITMSIGGTTFFSWQCKDCNSFLGNREPNEKEIIEAEKRRRKYEIWLIKEEEKRLLREQKKKQRQVAKEEADRLAGKKKRPKPLKRINRKSKVS